MPNESTATANTNVPQGTESNSAPEQDIKGRRLRAVQEPVRHDSLHSRDTLEADIRQALRSSRKKDGEGEYDDRGGRWGTPEEDEERVGNQGWDDRPGRKKGKGGRRGAPASTDDDEAEPSRTRATPDREDDDHEPERREEKVTAKRWLEFQRAQKKGREELQRERQELEQLRAQAREEVRPWARGIEALQKFQRGDFEGFLSEMGMTVSSFNQQLIRAHTRQEIQDPRVDHLVSYLQQQEAERQREHQERQRQAEEQQSAAQYQANIAHVESELTKRGYEGVRPAFVRHVTDVLLANYDHSSGTTLSVDEAAEMVAQHWDQHFGTRPSRRVARAPLRAPIESTPLASNGHTRSLDEDIALALGGNRRHRTPW